jgi:hypothetical protein
MKRILLTVLVTGLGIAAGVGMAQISTPASKAKPAPVKPSPGGKTTTAAAARSVNAPGVSAQEDQKIEAAIRAKLAKSKIGKDGFTVKVQGGVAYWEGGTGVVQHKGSATRMAKTAGAHAVINNIKVTDAAKQKAAENLDEGRRRAQVKRSDPRTQQ